jgi:hypothetical protein
MLAEGADNMSKTFRQHSEKDGVLVLRLGQQDKTCSVSIFCLTLFFHWMLRYLLTFIERHRCDVRGRERMSCRVEYPGGFSTIA